MKKILLSIVVLFIFHYNSNAQTITGVDVSSYQGVITWSSVKSAGYTYAIAKATEGVTIQDADFVNNEVNGTAAGVVMGAYHFAHPETNSAEAEAKYFVSVAGPYIKSCNLPPALDLEDPPSGPALTSAFTSAQLTAWVQAWFNAVDSATGIKPIIYTDGSIAGYLNSSLNTYGLWMADPDGNQSTPPASLGVWTTWKLKQFSWTGTVAGISGGSVDLDVFNGTSAAFTAFIGCNSVVASFTSNTKNVCPGSTVNFTDKSTSTGTINAWKWTFTGGNPTTSTVQNPSVTYSSPGAYSVKEVVTSTTGKDSVTYTSYIYVPSTGTLPLSETFQSSTFPPTGWYLNIPNPGDSVWELCKTNGYSSSQCMYFPANCGNVVNITGERQQIYTPDYSFASTTNAEMSFDVAYEPSKVPTYSDTLDIYYSTDCGSTWTMIYSKGGATLCTTGGSTSAGTDTNGAGCFVPPTTKAWRRDSINLSALNGKPNVMFSFESRSGWGNIIYIDNINVPSIPTSVQNVDESNNVKVYPNPNNGTFNIALSGTLTEKAQVAVFNLLGQQVYVAPISLGSNQVNLEGKSAGVYFYRIITETGSRLISEGKLIVQN